MVAKTRERLLEVARQLFVHKGLENTTMNDIAKASDKGRRTVYTYFRNKREIYDAVLESDSENMVEQLRAVANATDIGATEKLERFLSMRADLCSTLGSNIGSLKALLKFDVKRMSRIRGMVREKEKAILASILDQGVAEGEFDAGQCENFKGFALSIMQAFEVIEMAGRSGYMSGSDAMQSMSRFVVRGLKIRN